MNTNTRSRLAKLLQVIKAHITEISVAELNTQLQENPNFMLIDIRGQDEWFQGHLPHAVFCNRGVLETRIENMVQDENKEIILYCGGGTRSALSAETLQRMGYTNVKSVTEGYRGWVQAGYTTKMPE